MHDVGHDLVSRQGIVCVKCVNSALLGLFILARAGDATEYEEAQVVRVDGRNAVHHLAHLIVFVERLPHEVHILSDRLSGALAEHNVVEQRK
jgi:hypothetical protein